MNLYAEELSESDRVRIMIRNIFGYYVLERILMRCEDDLIKEKLRQEIEKNSVHLSIKQLRAKWLDLISRSRKC